MRLGYPHPDVLLPLLSASQFADWLAFFDERPWGEERADHRQAAMIQHLLRPHYKNASTVDLPRFTWPYFQSGEDKASEWRKRLKWQQATIENTVQHEEDGVRYKIPPAELWELVMGDEEPWQ